MIFLTAFWLLYVSSNSSTLTEQWHALIGDKCDKITAICEHGGYASYDRCKEAGDEWAATKNAPKDFPRTYICKLEKGR
jgi:hypothetical protein